jgi:rsbT co-antagonist protein RsbR
MPDETRRRAHTNTHPEDDAVVGARVGGRLADHAGPLLEQWTRAASEGLRGRLTTGEVGHELESLQELLFAALSADTAAEARTGTEQLHAALSELSRTRALRGFSPTETATGVFALKSAFLEIFGDDPHAMADFPWLSTYVDRLGLHTFDAYVQARERTITEQAEQLLELSTPVVKLWEGVVAVPLVGTLDSARTQVVMEKLLQTLVDTGSEHAIIDITGVPAVDTQVAQHLLKTVVAARLMGADCIISGIRPQIAQTIVALGIEFGDIPTKATLADALQTALRRSGYQLHRTAR